jgi:predicted metal-dependent peptidase
MKRISKRFGTRPGIRIRRLNRVVVVIDTSGSVDNDTLFLFMAEIEGIRRTGAEITVIESDCEVQNVYAYRRGKEISMKGGGGTDFDPAFEYINSRKSGSFDACIYLTDGFAPEPEIKPRTSLLWVLTPDGNDDTHLKWGRRILLKQ